MSASPVSSAATHLAAPTRERVLTQTRFETGTLLRNGEQLLVALVLPAKALAVLSVEVLQFILIGGLALAFGWHPKWIALLPAALLTLLGTWAFVALALLLAGTMRAEGVLALANLIWICLLGLGGVIVPPSQMPAGLSHVATLLPSGALGAGLRVAFIGGRLSVTPVLVPVVWGAVEAPLASRTFSWSD